MVDDEQDPQEPPQVITFTGGVTLPSVGAGNAVQRPGGNPRES